MNKKNSAVHHRVSLEREIERCAVLLLLAALIVSAVPGRCWGYVIPQEQLIGFMVKGLPRLTTQVIIQSVHGPGAEGKVRREKVWLKSPDLFRREPLNRPQEGAGEGGGTGANATGDLLFWRLLMANEGAAVTQFLGLIGVNLDSVGFGRVNGAPAYRIGDNAAESPALFLEKERFLPLLLRYRCRSRGRTGTVSVHFGDYRDRAGGWYPHAFTCSAGDAIVVRYLVEKVEAKYALSAPRRTGNEDEKPLWITAADQFIEPLHPGFDSFHPTTL